jgi:putative sigma-54 modulation protein
MQVKVTFRNTEPNDDVRSRAEEKSEKIKKLMRSPIQVSFIFSKDKINHLTELTVTGDGAHLSSSVKSNDYFSAIDESIDKMVTQLKKHKDKTKIKTGASKPSKI